MRHSFHCFSTFAKQPLPCPTPPPPPPLPHPQAYQAICIHARRHSQNIGQTRSKNRCFRSKAYPSHSAHNLKPTESFFAICFTNQQSLDLANDNTLVLWDRFLFVRPRQVLRHVAACIQRLISKSGPSNNKMVLKKNPTKPNKKNPPNKQKQNISSNVSS